MKPKIDQQLKKKNTLLVLVLVSILTITVVIFLSHYLINSSKTDIVYVDNVKLFNGFNMSKDLGKINNKKTTAQKKKLDSLYTIYSVLKEQKNKVKTQELETQLRIEDQELRNMNEYFSKDLSQKVWNRLNQYIKEYGEAHHYKMVLGTQGNGNVMYAQEGIDITIKVLEYANTKYEGN